MKAHLRFDRRVVNAVETTTRAAEFEGLYFYCVALILFFQGDIDVSVKDR